MTMLMEVEFENVRNKLTNVIDRVQRLTPAVIKPRKNTEACIVILNENLVRLLLQEVIFSTKFYHEEDGSITLCIDDLELCTNGETEEEAFEELTDNLIDYTRDYMKDPSRYFKAPNRRKHFPYLFKVSLCSNKEEVKQLIKST